MRTYVLERVYDYMKKVGLDDEAEVFEEILHCVVGKICDSHVYGLDETLLGRGVALRWWKIRARYPDGECREHAPTTTEIFMSWKMAVEEQVDDIWSLRELLDELLLIAGGAKGEWMDANGVSAGKGAGAAAAAADTAEPLGSAGVSEHGAARGGCAGAEAGAAEAEYMDYGAKDEEAETDRILGALTRRSASERESELGFPGEGSGEAPDEAGRMEGRKTRRDRLPPMSERRTSLYAKGVCR